MAKRGRKPKQQTPPDKLAVYCVDCKLPAGIRRGGRRWEFGKHFVTDLTAAQISAIQSDPAFSLVKLNE